MAAKKRWIKRAERYAGLLRKSKELDRGICHIAHFEELTETEKLRVWSFLTKCGIKRG